MNSAIFALFVLGRLFAGVFGKRADRSMIGHDSHPPIPSYVCQEHKMTLMSDEELFYLPLEIQQAVANQRLEGLELPREVILDSLRYIRAICPISGNVPMDSALSIRVLPNLRARSGLSRAM